MDLLVEARTANYQKVYSRLELTRKIILEWQIDEVVEGQVT